MSLHPRTEPHDVARASVRRRRAGPRASRRFAARRRRPPGPPYPSPRAIPRADARASPAADPAVNADGMYDGTVFFHLYPELKSPKPIFSTFLEGALHCCEVARSHPDYCSAHFHEAIDQNDAIDCKPHGYFNMTLFKCPPDELFERFEDLHECLDIGHMDQVHHPMPCVELASAPGPTSAIAGVPHGVVRYSEKDAVVLVATPRHSGDSAHLDARDWRAWSGADVAAEKAGDAFLGASLHRCVDESSAFEHVVRIELGACDAGVVDACVARARGSAATAPSSAGSGARSTSRRPGRPRGRCRRFGRCKRRRERRRRRGACPSRTRGKKPGRFSRGPARAS